MHLPLTILHPARIEKGRITLLKYLKNRVHLAIEEYVSADPTKGRGTICRAPKYAESCDCAMLGGLYKAMRRTDWKRKYCNAALIRESVLEVQVKLSELCCLTTQAARPRTSLRNGVTGHPSCTPWPYVQLVLECGDMLVSGKSNPQKTSFDIGVIYQATKEEQNKLRSYAAEPES